MVAFQVDHCELCEYKSSKVELIEQILAEVESLEGGKHHLAETVDLLQGVVGDGQLF